jgi:hypothetical protein
MLYQLDMSSIEILHITYGDGLPKLPFTRCDCPSSRDSQRHWSGPHSTGVEHPLINFITDRRDAFCHCLFRP